MTGRAEPATGGPAPDRPATGRRATGRLLTDRAQSAVLGEPIELTVWLPPGYDDEPSRRYPSLYLLHGRGDSRRDWAEHVGLLDELVGQGTVPPLVAVMPDAPWSGRASYYVDSRHTGPPPGRPVETAFTQDLVGHVDATYRTRATGDARAVGGYSMGGAGALRFALAHRALFRAALVLSPAVYLPEPPADSSARTSGAFGVGAVRFDDARYAELGYPAVLATADERLPLHLAVAAGDREPLASRQARLLCRALRDAPGVTVQWQRHPGGHDWDTWAPAFRHALPGVTAVLG